MSSKKISWEPFPWEGLQPAPIIGVDEVGRGCLAGSVYAAAVILGPQYPQGLTDSKMLSPKRRKQFSLEILSTCQVSLGFATVQEIADINILQASLLAMRRAVLGLGVASGHILVDGNQKIPQLSTKDWVQTTIVKGDLRATPIAAASIVAKVTRDEEIVELAKTYPGYGLENHKGYATKVHKAAIAEKGPTPIHRPTFAGVKEFLPPTGTPL